MAFIMNTKKENTGNVLLFNLFNLQHLTVDSMNYLCMNAACSVECSHTWIRSGSAMYLKDHYNVWSVIDRKHWHEKPSRNTVQQKWWLNEFSSKHLLVISEWGTGTHCEQMVSTMTRLLWDSTLRDPNIIIDEKII